MKKIEAKIVADSVSPQGHRITSMLVTHPRFILAELNTHRLFSRNSASSRAIPFKKMVEMVEKDPFIPIAWQKDHKGMQGTEYITDSLFADLMKQEWLVARDAAILSAKRLNSGKIATDEQDLLGRYEPVTKQLCNRLLEPFMWHTTLITATEWDNFFDLRCPQYTFGKLTSNPRVWWSKKDAIKDFPHWIDNNDLFWQTFNESQAEIHIQALAEAMWDAMNESTPKKLREGEWHIPFGDKINAENYVGKNASALFNNGTGILSNANEVGLKIATARCARLSYMTHDGEIDYEKDIRLHDQLLNDGHMSPFEHCAMAMSNDEYYEFAKGRLLVKDGYGDGDSLEQNIDNGTPGWCNNFRGFIQYRFYIENGGIWYVYI